MNSMVKVLMLVLPTLTTSVIAADHKQCEPKAYEAALKYQQKSAEIMALQLQTYRFATERFNEKMKTITAPEKYAVVLDIDETVVDNTPLLVRDMQRCHDFTKWDTWGNWEQKGNPKLIPGAKAFLDQVDQKKVHIYYVSDRTQVNLAHTIATLKALGLPQVSQNTVLLATESKEKRRQKIVENQQIMMLFGDTLADFSAQFKNQKTSDEQRKLVLSAANHFGDDWIVLPNASYGSWSTATLDSWDEPTTK